MQLTMRSNSDELTVGFRWRSLLQGRRLKGQCFLSRRGPGFQPVALPELRQAMVLEQRLVYHNQEYRCVLLNELNTFRYTLETSPFELTVVRRSIPCHL